MTMVWNCLHLRRTLRVLLYAFLFLFGSSNLSAQTNAPMCSPPPKVRAALNHIDTQREGPNESDYEFWLSLRAELKALLQRHSSDFFVQRAYVGERIVGGLMGPDPSTGGFQSEKGRLQAIGEYKALHEQHPDDAVIEDLYAKTLIDRDTPAAIKLLDDSLQKKPSFPWPNLDLARIHSSPNFLDRSKAESHLSAFLTACPANLAGYNLLGSLGEDHFTRKSVAQFRKVLGTRTDARAIAEYPTLWGLEFKSHHPSDYGALRKQVAADLARIRTLKIDNDFGWPNPLRRSFPEDSWYVLYKGYELIGDQAQARWAETERAKHIPPFRSASPMPEVNQWFREHPYPEPDAPEQVKQAYNREELAQTDQWIKNYPNSRVAWDDRMSAMEALDNVPAAECKATFEKVLQLDEASAGPLPLFWQTYFKLADFLSRKHVEPAREVALAQKVLDTITAEWDRMPLNDLYSTKDDLDYLPNFNTPAMKARVLLYEAEGYTRLKRPDEAFAALAKANLQLEALNADMRADESRRPLQNRNATYEQYESEYWQRMARVAQLLGHDIDAMAYYQSALLARFDSGQMPPPGEKDELGDEARQLWARLGGTQEGWNGWYRQRAQEFASETHLVWQKSNEPLPSFRLTDLDGKTWQLADLKGKLVFLNFWAAW
jgi:hypothetical protein